MLNDNTKTHIDTRSGAKSNLDLIISTLNIREKINVTVLDDLHGSDHFPVFFDIQIYKNLYTRKTLKIKTIRTDWKKFTMELDEKYNEFLLNNYNILPPSKKYEYFVNIVTNALKSSNPKRHTNNSKRKNANNPAPWWSDQCNKVKKERKEAYAKWETTKCLADLIDYKRAHALATKTFKTEKKKNILSVLPNRLITELTKNMFETNVKF